MTWQDDRGESLGQREERLRQEARLAELRKAEEAETARVFRNWLERNTRAFKIHNETLSQDILLIVNLATGKTLAKGENDEAWSLLEPKFAKSWLRRGNIKAYEFSIYSRAMFPAAAEIAQRLPDFEDSRTARLARRRWRTRILSQRVASVVESFQESVGTLFAMLFCVLMIGVAAFFLVVVAGGVWGLLNFGWKNL